MQKVSNPGPATNFDTLKKIAQYCEQSGIEYTILSGYFPDSTFTGRDIDILVPCEAQARLLLIKCEEIIKESGFQHCFITDPIWGFRCIGITPELQYFELHIVHYFKVLTVPVLKFFPITAPLDSNGIRTSKLYVFFKKVLVKGNRKILKLKPIWNDDKDKQVHEIVKELENIPPELSNLVDKAAEEDSTSSYISRREALIAFLFLSLKAPVEAIKLTLKDNIKKLLTVYLSPCAPVIQLKFSTDNHQLSNKDKQHIKHRLGHIFLDVVFIQKITLFEILRVRKLQGRQCLVVTHMPSKYVKTIPITLAADFQANATGLQSIIVSFAEFNRRWSSYFQRA